ncbi:MAG: NAD(P)H-dependent oxidoreductase [Myxococcales bacterium]|nr:NAD(P)H-dependent oxidoreductase [Myxococcales bacterium]
MQERVLIVMAHPRAESLSNALAERYAEAAVAAGAEVAWLRLAEMRFDPSLHAGHAGPQALEADLVEAQERLRWATQTVWVFPVWWGSFPAVLKGFFDRVLVPGFAFRYRAGGKIERLLGGRRARVIMTHDWPRWAYWLYLGAPAHRVIDRATLGFCGFDPVRITSFHEVIHSTPAARAAWLDAVTRAARQDLGGAPRSRLAALP